MGEEKGRDFSYLKFICDFHMGGYGESAIAQQYIAPCLLEGLKFDFRIYALVSSIDPLRVYIFREGMTPAQVADVAMQGIPYDIFDELPVTYRCDCGRIRMRDGIRRVGEKEILAMLAEEEAEGHPRELEAVCRFCGKKYRFTESELLKR